MASFMIPFKALFFLIVVLRQPPFVFASSSSVAANETETLLKWKASLDNNTQTLLSSLWVGGNHCNWVGITCDMDGTITDLSLPDHMLNLKGALHSLNFFFFPNLVWLNLRNNSLYGSIPSQIGNLSKLTHLDLSYNTFSGNIPSEISLLRSLELISLSNNEINGSIPQEIGRLSSVSVDTDFVREVEKSLWENFEIFQPLMTGDPGGGRRGGPAIRRWPVGALPVELPLSL
ncbi:probable leucine-rich repeat receptor-like protein kinase At2g33170 [Durio zibethinus]|uniref:Probable leucine-rich repeat receptor-like protein kinase At2g33170 n=1 Tax=Durio zibethinus TaxID=66656 RepID=A0A6P5ZHW5_DURZI|nr:probable leucine-rich repeat receptor-like protein kinase At2g33170 [Durio zibethinus]